MNPKFNTQQIVPFLFFLFVLGLIFGKNFFPILIAIFVIFLIINIFKKINLKKHMDPENVINVGTGKSSLNPKRVKNRLNYSWRCYFINPAAFGYQGGAGW